MDIDFLPEKFRERYHVRYQRLWRVGVTLLFVGIVGGSASLQRWLRQDAQRQLDELTSTHVAALKINRQLASLYDRIDREKRQAALLTYLRHPWPTTQLLNQALSPLERGLTIGSLRLYAQHTAPPSAQQRGATAVAPQNKNSERKSGAEQDLKTLRARYDGRRYVVEISGVTRDLDAFHRYVGKLALMPLFEHVEIARLETASPSDRQVEFLIRIEILPGPGQTGNLPPRQARLREEQARWQR